MTKIKTLMIHTLWPSYPFDWHTYLRVIECYISVALAINITHNFDKEGKGGKKILYLTDLKSI